MNTKHISKAKFKGEWYEVKGKYKEQRINYTDEGLKLLIGGKIEEIPFKKISETK